MIIPLKKSVRDRKFYQKTPIVIPARADPFLQCAELLWMIVPLNPCASDEVYVFLAYSIFYQHCSTASLKSIKFCGSKTKQNRYLRCSSAAPCCFLPVLLRKTGKNARKAALLSAFLRFRPCSFPRDKK